MALQTSGAISLADIAGEFGGAAPHSMSEYRGSGGTPSSGSISFYDFYGVTDFTATWGGGSSQITLFNNTHIMETSGSLFRYGVNGGRGAWLTANQDGTFTNGQSTSSDVGFYAGGYSLSSSASSIVLHQTGEGYGQTYFNTSNGFTGSSGRDSYTLNSSGGLVRLSYSGSTYSSASYGDYLSLT
jgi:hypothetical protein